MDTLTARIYKAPTRLGLLIRLQSVIKILCRPRSFCFYYLLLNIHVPISNRNIHIPVIYWSMIDALFLIVKKSVEDLRFEDDNLIVRGEMQPRLQFAIFICFISY